MENGLFFFPTPHTNPLLPPQSDMASKANIRSMWNETRTRIENSRLEEQIFVERGEIETEKIAQIECEKI